MAALAGGKRFPTGNAIAKIVRWDRFVDDSSCEFQSRSPLERFCFVLRRARSKRLFGSGNEASRYPTPERAELSAQGVRTIYWQAGELENVGETWRWKARFALPRTRAPGGLRFVPVVRLESREKSPFSKTSLEALLGALSTVTKGADELQIDYDAPDRLVEEYAAALKKIHALVPKLGITALPGWSRSPILRVLESSVDELLPMLYDFEPDPVVAGAAPLPLLVPEKLERSLEEWSRLPNRVERGASLFCARYTLRSFRKIARSHPRLELGRSLFQQVARHASTNRARRDGLQGARPRPG